MTTLHIWRDKLQLDSIYIIQDTLINGFKYYKFSDLTTDLFRYDIDSNKAFLKYDDSEYIYCDFDFTRDSVFNQMTPISHYYRTVVIPKDTTTYFYFGQSRYTIGWRTRYSYDYYSEKFAEGLGIVGRGSGHQGPGPKFDEVSFLINAILYDSLNNYTYYTYGYKPEIEFQPFSIIGDSVNKVFSAQVDHHYNRLQTFLGTISDGIIYVDSVFFELFYQKDFVNTSLEEYYAVRTPATFSYSFNIPIDTSLLKNGYKFLYRIGAKDKAFFPEYSYSPDSGYYSAEYIPTSYTDDKQNIITFFISQNFPNPFNPATKINYSVAVPINVSIKIYDVLGREVSTLVNKEKSIGNYSVEFNAANLPSGIYFYQIKCGNFIQTKKMILMR